MPKTRLRVLQQWQQHLDAPVTLVATAREDGAVFAAGEDASVYLLDRQGELLWTKALPFMPSGLGLDSAGELAAAASPDGEIRLYGRRGDERPRRRALYRPSWIDVSPGGDRLAVADGSGRVSIVATGTGRQEHMEFRARYYYVKFLAERQALLGVGRFGEVMLLKESEGVFWEKNFRCHTRQPAASAQGELILVPSPHFGIIALGADGRDRGLFEVPGGPKSVAVRDDGDRIFVVNDENELIIFDARGSVLFKQPFGEGVFQLECDSLGGRLVAAATSGALEGFSLDAPRRGKGDYLEFGIEKTRAAAPAGEVVWERKIFSALAGPRGGQLAVTPRGRHVAVLDIRGNLCVYDASGDQVAPAERMRGLRPGLKGCRSREFVAAATTDMLLALDLRSYTQRRLGVKNEWATHFDISPGEIFVAVSDFFRGVSFYDESFERCEYVETADEIIDLAVDGNCRTLVVLHRAGLAVYERSGALSEHVPFDTGDVRAAVGLDSGFAVATGRGVHTFTSEGQPRWTLELEEGVAAVQQAGPSLVVVGRDGTTHVANPYGTVVHRTRRSADCRYFAAPGHTSETLSAERHRRLLTVRSSERGVLWRREMADEITGLEISPEGRFVAVMAGVNLTLLSTLPGEKSREERLYLEI